MSCTFQHLSELSLGDLAIWNSMQNIYMLMPSFRKFITIPVSRNLLELSSCGSPPIGDRGDESHPSDSGLHVLLQRHHQRQGQRRAQDLLCAHRDDPLSVSRECSAVASWICTARTTTHSWFFRIECLFCRRNGTGGPILMFCCELPGSAAVVSIVP